VSSFLDFPPLLLFWTLIILNLGYLLKLIEKKDIR